MLYRLMHLRHSTTQTSPGFYNSTISSGIAKLTSMYVKKAKKYLYPIKATPLILTSEYSSP